jgi:RimJ/RimL family protein N-acetyltransferase
VLGGDLDLAARNSKQCLAVDDEPGHTSDDTPTSFTWPLVTALYCEEMRAARAEEVGLRPVRDADLEIFYGHQLEPEAVSMALFPSRDRDTFFRHWKTNTLVRPDARAMTITYGDSVAGNIGSWATEEHVLVGYWIGKAYWGRGVATGALQRFIAEHEPRRPLHAHVVAANVGSIRVLEKCGFEIVERTREFDESFGIEVEELLMAYKR